MRWPNVFSSPGVYAWDTDAATSGISPFKGLRLRLDKPLKGLVIVVAATATQA
jgi:hypothetical protein